MTPLRCMNAPSTARSFLRVAHRSYCSTTASATHSCAAPLEFLVPRSALRTSPPAKVRSYEPLLQIRALQVRSTRGDYGISRSFSSSAVRRATVCVQNPVKDEDGNEMMLEITPRAAKRLSDIMTKDANPNLALRISVESGGCHGFQYLMSLVTLPEKDTPQWSEVVNEDDSIFQFTADGSESSTPSSESARIILDEPSLELLKGSKVDFTMELIGSQFKIVDNPYATSSCGCGTSFDIKM